MKKFRFAVAIMLVVSVVSSLMMHQEVYADTSYKPVIQVEELDKNSVISGKSIETTITLKNVGVYTAKAISVSVVEEVDGPLNIETDVVNTYVDTLKKNETIDIKLRIRADEDAKTGTYPIKVTGVYSKVANQGGELVFTEYELSEVVNIRVTENKSYNNLNASVVVDEPLYAGEDGQIKLTLADESEEELKDIQVTLENPDGPGIKPVVYGPVSVEPIFHDAKELILDVKVDENISGYMPLKVKVDLVERMSNLKVTEEFTLYAYVNEKAKSNVFIKEAVANDYSIRPEQSTTLKVTIENTKETAAKNLNLLVSSEKGLILNGQSSYVINELSKGEVTYEFSLKAPKDMGSGNYPVSISLTENGEDKGIVSTSIYVNNSSKKNTSAPRIIIENFKLLSSRDDNKIMVGDDFSLEMLVKNTSQTKSVNSLKAVITGNDGGTSLLPVNQSNSIYIGSLGPNEAKVITIPYQVLENVNGGVYELNASFEFEDVDYEAFKDSETIFVPIYSEGKLQVSDVHIGKELDNSYTLNLDFYNVGKKEITNLMVDIESDLNTKNSNYYVGDFSKGRMDVYEVQVMGVAPENIEGTIVFTYDDTFGKSETYEVPFVIKNEKPEVEVGLDGSGGNELMLDDMSEGGSKGVLGGNLKYIIGAVALLIVIVLFRRRKKRAEE